MKAEITRSKDKYQIVISTRHGEIIERWQVDYLEMDEGTLATMDMIRLIKQDREV